MPKVFVRASRVLVIVLVAVSLAGCDVMVNTMHGGNGRASDVWTRSYTLTPNGELEISNVNGKIEVESSDGSKVEVRAERSARASTDEAARKLLEDSTIREDVTADRIRLETPSQRLRRASLEVRYRVTVPKTARVRLETVNGGIEVTGVEGQLRAESTNGKVVGRRLGSSVNASTTNGGIELEVDKLSEDGITLETTNGGIELRLPSDAKATVSARCTNGGISVTEGLQMKTSGETSNRRLEATLNGGGAPIRLETTNGGIRVGKL
jgi:DUF4097 and DUF4098 domain-containing protein YvlB